MWRILNLSLFSLAFIAGLSMSPLPPSPEATSSWLEFSLGVPIGLASEVCLLWFYTKQNPALLPLLRPSLNQNPFNTKRVLAFSWSGAILFLSLGLGQVIRAILSGGLLSPSDAMFFVLGGVALAGVYLFMRLFPQYVATSQPAKNLGV